MRTSGTEIAIPAIVTELADGKSPELVWRNELDGLTYCIGKRFVKWNPAGNGINLADEVARLTWAAGKWKVPKLVSSGHNPEGAWIVTEAVDGLSAIHQTWLDRPFEAVRAIGVGLRQLHDTLPPDDCHFDWGLQSRLTRANKLFPGSPELEKLGPPPTIDQLVVCHGDACSPNTLISHSGEFLAHVDLGSLGVADRWADLAVATMAVTWNFGQGFEGYLLEAYGIEPEPLRTEYYRRLWHLSS